ncbi:MAG: GTPase HflX [Flammeovirgaceae bacterium]|nr:GTPase HflX [Flammeovirgaceae bacterium]
MQKTETAVLVSLGNSRTLTEEIEEHLDELAFLAETLRIDTVSRFIQRLPTPDVRTYLGKGKIDEVKNYVFAHSVNYVIFDDDLSPSQLRNIEKMMNPADREERVLIYDRSLLILDIFVKRAQTAQARTQVELAMNQYLLPRLTRLWTHLERQRGGTGTRGGAGEKEIETDRRNIRYKISVLKKELEKIDRQRKTQRKNRNQIVRVALVGYTNVGKSTLMNLLTKANVKAENKLFATVDSTVRKVVIDQIPFLLSDTVGFIRKLPHHLIESFKSTLDEVCEADILLHVVDVSHPFHHKQIDVVKTTLAEIGAGSIPSILILNKTDQLLAKEPEISLENMVSHYRESGYDKVIFVSATTKFNLTEVRQLLIDEVRKIHVRIFPNYMKDEFGFSVVQSDSIET